MRILVFYQRHGFRGHSHAALGHRARKLMALGLNLGLAGARLGTVPDSPGTLGTS